MAHRRFECVVKSGQSPGLFDIYDSFCTLPYYLQLPILRECVLVLKKPILFLKRITYKSICRFLALEYSGLVL